MRKIWNYIVAFIFFILAIVKIYMPNLILKIKDNIDLTSVLFIIVGILVVLYKHIILMIKNISKYISMRILISMLCLLLVILKMFYNELILDNTSIYLVIIAILIIIVPDLDNVINRVTKFKSGEIEVELGINSLSNQVEAVEKEVEKGNIKLNYSGIDIKTEERLKLISNDPNALILIIGVEIESKMRKFLDVQAGAVRAANWMLRELEKTEILNKNQIEMISEFKRVKNMVAHGVVKDQITDEQLYEIANLGMRILQILPDLILIENTNKE